MKAKNFLIAMALCLCANAFAQTSEPAAVDAPKDRSQTTEMLQVAGQLVRYGYQTKSALPLIQAVDIYHKIGVTDETVAKEKTEESTEAAEAPSTKTSTVSYDEKQLLADATTYAEGDKNLIALIKQVGGDRGRVGDAARHVDLVKASSTDSYNITFRGGELAMVIVSGDGDTDLDLYVYDENGNLITSDTDYTDDCVVTFRPRWTGKFTIKIRNRGRVANRYVLVTN